MKLFCITGDKNRNQKELLLKTCQSRDVEFIEINPSTFDFVQKPEVNLSDLCFRVSTSSQARILEKSLLRNDLATFYVDPPTAIPDFSNSFIIHEKEGIPIPKTIPYLTANRDLLRIYAEQVGGFPLVIKVLGGSHGIGVMKIDSIESLFSVVDCVLPTCELLIMRQFIKAKESARLVVLGNEVIDSYAYIVPEGDFRSNTGLSPNVVLKRYSKEIEAVAIKAVQAMHLEVGGVDVIIDDRGEHYVMEVNFPFNFARAQNLTGTDVSGMMIDHLIKKTHLQNIGSNS